MKKIEMKLDIHTPWYRFSKKDKVDSMKSFIDYMETMHFFQCEDLCRIGISNGGDVIITFNEEKSEKEVRELMAIMLYFISICNGFNCQYKELAIVDGVAKQNFFNYAQEDECDCILFKNIKFYQLSLEEIESHFGTIMYQLFTMDRRLCLALLSNYYSMVVYKDFIGNGEYKFRNIVTNIESLITLINKEKYNEFKRTNKEFIKTINKDLSISITNLNKHIMPKSVSLEDKLKDVFEFYKNDGLIFKGNIGRECTKIANTRNFISHLFENDMEYLSDSEIGGYTAALEELFRIIFLEYVGIDRQLILKNFLINEPIRMTLQKIFFVSDY